MKILHVHLCGPFTEGLNYQENILPVINKKHGHEVKIIASTEKYVHSNRLGYIKPGKYVDDNKINIVRVPYRNFLPRIIMSKVRAYKHVYEVVSEFNPEIILQHGVPAYELLTLARYKKENPNIRFYVDSHEDFHNSARNFLSREILHRRFYKPIIQKALPYIDKILCVSLEVFDFLEKIYDIPRSMMEFYPLGGIVIDGIEYQKRRKKIRRNLGLSEEELLFVHSGKLNRKKRTEDVLKAFSMVKGSKLRLLLIGHLNKDIEKNVRALIAQDERISFVGWKTGEEVLDYLCACDMYLQPGTQSATLQNAICCGCPIMVYPYKSHDAYLKGNGFFVKNTNDMIEVFKKVYENPNLLDDMKTASLKIAYELLDYSKLAKRLYV